jgi:hypothetical protein
VLSRVTGFSDLLIRLKSLEIILKASWKLQLYNFSTILKQSNISLVPKSLAVNLFPLYFILFAAMLYSCILYYVIQYWI